MKRFLLFNHPLQTPAAASAARWWHLLPLLALLLGAPGAWAQTAYTIGTNITTCTGNIYDSGGANGAYQNNESLTTVITPATAGAKVQLNFTAFGVETCCDDLSIYDGPSTSSPLIGTYTASPGIITATSSTGQLTLVFESDVSITDLGFAAGITCVTNVPNIVSFTPTSGLPGTSVVITGTNFTGATAVSFNGVAAPGFVVNSATQITATVPTGAATGPVRVVVNNVTASSSTPFTVPAPTIASFTPTSGPAGTSVVITGTNFTGTTAVNIGGTPVTVFTVNSATQITLTVPASAFSGPIAVTTPAGTATSTGTYNTGNASFLIGNNITTCSGILFDSGGPNGQYQNNENRTTVLTSATGSQVVLNFTAFDLENNFDYLTVYDGPTAASPQIGRFTGTTNPGTITASGSQLTLVFMSDITGTRAGFAAGISCLDCAPVANPVANNITTSGASIAFTPGYGNASYTVTYSTAGGPTQTATGGASPIALSGLLAATQYTVSILPTCPLGTATATTFTFTTLLPNDDPAGALNIPVNTTCTTPTPGSNLGATYTIANGYNNPGCGNATIPKDVWFRFTTTATGSTANAVVMNITGNPAGQVRVLSTATGSATPTGPLTEVACSAGRSNNTAAPSFLVQGLTPSTTYFVQVSGYGSGDTQGAFTLCISAAPAAVTTPTVTNITTNSANLAFTAPTGATGYTITYSTPGYAPVTITSATSPVSLTGLIPNAPYTVTVTANYPNGGVSPTATTSFTTSQVSATRAALGNGQLSVYPNPAQRSFTLTLPAVAGSRTAQATLLNSLGQAMQTRAIALNADGTQVQVDATGLAAGIYTLRVQAGSQLATIKVAINN